MDSLSYASNGVQLTDQRKDLTVFTRLDYNAPKYSVLEESQSGDFQIEHHLPNQARFVGNIGLPNLGFWIDSLPFQWNIPVDNIDESYENYKIFISWIVNQPATQYLNLYHTIPDEVQLALDSLKNKGSDYVDIHNVAFIYNPDQNPRINTNSFSINTNRYYYQFNEIVESSNFENSSWTYLENENEIIQYFSGNTSNIKIFITWKMKLIDHGIFDGIMSMIAGYPTLSNVALTGFKMNEDFYKKINDYLEVEFVDFVY
jgi:hypothetical protein